MDVLCVGVRERMCGYPISDRTCMEMLLKLSRLSRQQQQQQQLQLDSLDLNFSKTMLDIMIPKCRTYRSLDQGFFQDPIGGYTPQQTCSTPNAQTPDGSQFGLHPSRSVSPSKLKILQESPIPRLR